MMRAAGCELIGDHTAGSSGNPHPVNLGNGVTAMVPSWQDLRPDGTCFEGEGISPDIQVRYEPSNLGIGDPVLQVGLKELRKVKNP
jgi:C-terminal processing protease CtpA/Prc